MMRCSATITMAACWNSISSWRTISMTWMDWMGFWIDSVHMYRPISMFRPLRVNRISAFHFCRNHSNRPLCKPHRKHSPMQHRPSIRFIKRRAHKPCPYNWAPDRSATFDCRTEPFTWDPVRSAISTISKRSISWMRFNVDRVHRRARWHLAKCRVEATALRRRLGATVNHQNCSVASWMLWNAFLYSLIYLCYFSIESVSEKSGFQMLAVFRFVCEIVGKCFTNNSKFDVFIGISHFCKNQMKENRELFW